MPVTIVVPPGAVFTIRGADEPSLRWHVGPCVQKASAAMAVEVSMSTEEKVRLSVTPLTPGGQPAPVDGAVKWSVDGSCTLEGIDATSTWVLAGAQVGDSVVTAAADADLGAGVVPLADTATIHVANPLAANLGMAADTPVLKP